MAESRWWSDDRLPIAPAALTRLERVAIHETKKDLLDDFVAPLDLQRTICGFQILDSVLNCGRKLVEVWRAPLYRIDLVLSDTTRFQNTSLLVDLKRTYCVP